MLLRIRRFFEALSKILCLIGGIAVVGMSVIVTYSSISRYVFGVAVSYMEEVAGLLLMVVSFTSIAYIFIKGGHIRVMLILGNLPPTLKSIVELITRFILLFYLIIFTKVSYSFVLTSYMLDCHTADSNLYEVPWMAVMPLSGLVFAIVVFVSCLEPLWNVISGKTNKLEFTMGSKEEEDELLETF